MANKTVTVGDGKTYPSLNAALATESTDLVSTLDGILTIECYHFDAKDTTAATTGTGYTTDASHYINIIAVDKHQGVRPTAASHYCLETTTNWDPSLIIAEDYTRVNGLAVKNASASGSIGIGISAASYCRVIDTIVYDCGLNGISASSTDTILNNCIAMKCGGYGISGMDSGKNFYFYNCVAVNCAGDGFMVGAWSTLYAKNCYSGGNTGTDYAHGVEGAYDFTTSYSEDGSEGTTTAAFSTSAGCYFTNVTAGTENLDITSNSTLIDAGTDLGADAKWIHPDGEVDIAGRTRGNNAWDIGAFEYVAAGGRTTKNTDCCSLGTAFGMAFGMKRYR